VQRHPYAAFGGASSQGSSPLGRYCYGFRRQSVAGVLRADPWSVPS